MKSVSFCFEIFMFVIHCNRSLVPSGFCKNKTKGSYISISSSGAIPNKLYKWSIWEHFTFAKNTTEFKETPRKFLKFV